MSAGPAEPLGALLVSEPGPLARELESGLQHLGWSVIHCARADEAVSAWETGPPALALVVVDDSPRARAGSCFGRCEGCRPATPW